MTDFPDDLPAGWHSYDTPPGANEEFGTQPTWLFAREAHDVGVMVRPLDTDAPHSEGGFQVAITRGTPDEAELVERLRNVGEREEALELAREVMATCDDLFEDDDLDPERAAAELR